MTLALPAVAELSVGAVGAEADPPPPFWTVTVTLELAVLPARSVVTAVRVWLPFATSCVFHA